VRGLIVLVLVIGAGLGWIVRSARIQRDAVAAIESTGGSVEYDWHENANGETWPPGWLVDRIGVHFCLHVTHVFIADSATNREMVQVRRLSQLQYLNLSNTMITDAGLTDLNKLTSLRELHLSTRITDVGLVQLEGLNSLRELNLENSKITDAGLVHMNGLKSLRRLNLDNTQITDAGLVHLRGLSSLQDLCLRDTKITDDGLAHLKGLNNLRELDLGMTVVTDAGLVHLKGLKSLETLYIPATNITDAGARQEPFPRFEFSYDLH